MNQENSEGIVLPPGCDMSLYQNSGEPVSQMPKRTNTDTIFQTFLHQRICMKAESKNGRKICICGYLRKCDEAYLCIENEKGLTLFHTSDMLYFRIQKEF